MSRRITGEIYNRNRGDAGIKKSCENGRFVYNVGIVPKEREACPDEADK